MALREHIPPCTRAATAGIITLLLILPVLFCGCLDVEPEELPPAAASPPVTTAVSPAVTTGTTEKNSTPPPPLVITSPKQTRHFTELGFPPEVTGSVSGFALGKTADSINGFLRWESVRARTGKDEKARIQEQIRRIDYALYNTSLRENIRVYIGLSGEQAKRVRNDSVFSESGYLIASSDPSVVYHNFANSRRDSDGYFTMGVIDFQRGDRLLLVNTTEREFLLPHGGIWDVAYEVTYEELEYSADSIPRYDDIVPTNVRLIYTKEHP